MGFLLNLDLFHSHYLILQSYLWIGLIVVHTHNLTLKYLKIIFILSISDKFLQIITKIQINSYIVIKI